MDTIMNQGAVAMMRRMVTVLLLWISGIIRKLQFSVNMLPDFHKIHLFFVEYHRRDVLFIHASSLKNQVLWSLSWENFVFHGFYPGNIDLGILPGYIVAQ